MDGSLRVLDVQEREVGAARAPSFPTARPTAAGFPQPKKRARFASAFKQQRQASAAAEAAKTGTAVQAAAASSPARPTAGLDDKAAIDRENRERLRAMSPSEIEAERRELLENLDPSLLQLLLRRANLDDAAAGTRLPGEEEEEEEETPKAPPPEIRVDDTAAEARRGSDQETEKDEAAAATPKRSLLSSCVDEEEADRGSGEGTARRRTGDEALLGDASVPPAGRLAPISSPEAVLHEHENKHEHDHDHDHAAAPAMHFPQAPAVPDLDPEDPDFLQHLHDKYFPNLPADPARLAWMAPLPTADSPADRESPYYPGQASLAVSQLRFDFRGRLVPPRRSRAIPVSKGLHHHGVAPEAAGYTIGELARLARSAVPAQRCVAFQTLGRVLYRLGRGEWGDGGGGGGSGGGTASNPAVDEATRDPRAQLAQGIWRAVSEGRVLDTLREAAGVEEGRGHRGSRAYAIEAVWLYEKGGWKERWSGR